MDKREFDAPLLMWVITVYVNFRPESLLDIISNNGNIIIRQVL